MVLLSVLERRERFQQTFSVKFSAATLTFAVVLVWSGTPAGSTAVSPFKHLFGVGDGFLDTGNRDPTNNSIITSAAILVDQDWKYPYGITLGAPVGRFSDGVLFFDFLAAALGLNPVPYRVYSGNPSQISPADGINFAVASAGVSYDFGFTTTGGQISELQGILARNVMYNLSQSLVYSVNGNDYAEYVVENGFNDILLLYLFVFRVVDQIVADVQQLYNLGFTNIAVTQLPPLGCEPINTITYNYTFCSSIYNFLVAHHNTLLASNLATQLPNANIILIDFYSAFNSILDAPAGTSGFSSPILKPCCAGTSSTTGCAFVDSSNNPLYTLCTNPSQSFFWDSQHVTQAAWTKIFPLFLTSSLYTNGTISLLCFLYPQFC